MSGIKIRIISPDCGGQVKIVRIRPRGSGREALPRENSNTSKLYRLPRLYVTERKREERERRAATFLYIRDVRAVPYSG